MVYTRDHPHKKNSESNHDRLLGEAIEIPIGDGRPNLDLGWKKDVTTDWVQLINFLYILKRKLEGNR
jgi:hypothetical protein